jgi:hypothetical protein
MKISHKQGVGFKPIPLKNKNPLEFPRGNSNRMKAVSALFLKKRVSKRQDGEG